VGGRAIACPIQPTWPYGLLWQSRPPRRPSGKPGVLSVLLLVPAGGGRASAFPSTSLEPPLPEGRSAFVAEAASAKWARSASDRESAEGLHGKRRAAPKVSDFDQGLPGSGSTSRLRSSRGELPGVDGQEAGDKRLGAATAAVALRGWNRCSSHTQTPKASEPLGEGSRKGSPATVSIVALRMQLPRIPAGIGPRPGETGPADAALRATLAESARATPPVELRRVAVRLRVLLPSTCRPGTDFALLSRPAERPAECHGRPQSGQPEGVPGPGGAGAHEH
jgi:hypothetical protein